MVRDANCIAVSIRRVPVSAQQWWSRAVHVADLVPVPSIRRTSDNQLLVRMRSALFPAVRRQTGEIRGRREKITPDDIVRFPLHVSN